MRKRFPIPESSDKLLTQSALILQNKFGTITAADVDQFWQSILPGELPTFGKPDDLLQFLQEF